MYSLQIVLTHEHADAVLGLDDIRAVQPFSPTNDIAPTAIYLAQETMDRYLLNHFLTVAYHSLAKSVDCNILYYVIVITTCGIYLKQKYYDKYLHSCAFCGT